MGIFHYSNSSVSPKRRITNTMSEEFENHVPLPKSTHAFECAKCGAVSLDPNNLCKVMGKVTKGDWCGTKSIVSPKQCQNNVNTTRYVCNNCGRVSMNSELLCKPQKMAPTAPAESD